MNDGVVPQNEVDAVPHPLGQPSQQSRDMESTRLVVMPQSQWVSAKQRFKCRICTKRFSLFRHKHHCRACGAVICSSCALFRAIDTQAVLVCISCAAFHSLECPLSTAPTARTRPASGGATFHRNRSSTFNSEISLNPWPEPPFPEDEEERLAAVRKLNTRDLRLAGKFDMFCEVAAKTMKCPISYVSLIDDKQQLLLASVGMAHTTLPRELSFCAHTICHPWVLVVLDTKNDERFRENPMVMGDKARMIRYYAGASIFTRDGHALGTVAVLDTKPRRKADQEHIGVLQHLSFLASGMMTRSAVNIYEG